MNTKFDAMIARAMMVYGWSGKLTLHYKGLLYDGY